MLTRNPNNTPDTLKAQREGTSRRGAMLVLIAVLMTVFIITLVFTIDVAYMQLVRTQLRVAADASAKAGMETLARTNNPALARAAARDILGKNVVAGRSLQLADSDIAFGRANPRDDGSWAFQPAPVPYRAVRVNVSLVEGSINGTVPLLFGRILGQQNFTPTHASVAANLTHEVVLALDRSHSMCFDLTGNDWSYPPGIPAFPTAYITPPSRNGSRWRELEMAIDEFVYEIGKLSIQPNIGVVTWGSDLTLGAAWKPHNGRSFPAVEVDLPLGQNLPGIQQAISARYDDIMMGATNMSAGIDGAVQLLITGNTNPLAQKTIILMSDGQWNQGRHPSLAADDAAAHNIVIHAISFMESNGSAIAEVAERTGGRFYYAPDGLTLRRAFAELARALPVVLIE